MTSNKMFSILLTAMLATTGVNAAESVADDAERNLAIAALDNMSAYLRSLDKFNIRTSISKDQVLSEGQKIQFDSQMSMVVNPPKQLFSTVQTSDGSEKQFYYDGKKFTIYTPTLRYFASFDAPDTLGKTVVLAQEKFAIEMPLADLFFWGTGDADYTAITDAKIIGVNRVDGVSCNHLAFRQQDVDWQICIQRGTQPLPLKLVITTTDIAEQPQYVATMKWDVAPQQEGTDFSFRPRQGDQQITFARGEK